MANCKSDTLCHVPIRLWNSCSWSWTHFPLCMFISSIFRCEILIPETHFLLRCVACISLAYSLSHQIRPHPLEFSHLIPLMWRVCAVHFPLLRVPSYDVAFLRILAYSPLNQARVKQYSSFFSETSQPPSILFNLLLNFNQRCSPSVFSLPPSFWPSPPLSLIGLLENVFFMIFFMKLNETASDSGVHQVFYHIGEHMMMKCVFGFFQRIDWRGNESCASDIQL